MEDIKHTIWQIDPGHSNIRFKVKHLAIANIVGTFINFNGQVKTNDNNFDAAAVKLLIEADSLNTNNSIRDEHLRSDIFLDCSNFPEICFEGNLIKKEAEYELFGQLTIRDVSRLLTMKVKHIGTGKDKFENTRAGFEITGTINRKDYGIAWHILTEAGSMIVGEEVDLTIDIELCKT